MKDIDFLPARYREHSRLRRAMAWRLVIVCAFSAAVCAVHFAQTSNRKALEQQVHLVRPPHLAAVKSMERLQRLQHELGDSQQYAELYTYLQHPWPRTQLLAEIVQTLPDTLALTEIKIAFGPANPEASPGAPSKPTEEVPSARRDLKALRDENDLGTPLVTVTGTTRDISALQEYVAGFRHSHFFSTAKLESLESLKNSEDTAASQFELRLRVRPGYGQPGGPSPLKSGPRNDQTAYTMEIGR